MARTEARLRRVVHRDRLEQTPACAEHVHVVDVDPVLEVGARRREEEGLPATEDGRMPCAVRSTTMTAPTAGAAMPETVSLVRCRGAGPPSKPSMNITGARLKRRGSSQAEDVAGPITTTHSAARSVLRASPIV